MEYIFHMDKKDKKILEVLAKDSSLSTQKIAKHTLIPITTVHNRIKKLKKEGIITRYTVELNRKKIGQLISAHVLVEADTKVLKAKKKNQEDLAKAIKKYPEVERISIITGRSDLLLTLHAKDVDELNNFIVTRLRNIEGISTTQTMVVLKEI